MTEGAREADPARGAGRARRPPSRGGPARLLGGLARRTGLKRLVSRRRLERAKMRGRPRAVSLLARLRGERVVHLLHIRKTGGTAVKAALRDCPVPRGTRLLLHRHAVLLSDIPRRDQVVFFVRDPVSRYVSGLNDRLREGRPRFVSPWSPDERRIFARFTSAEELASALGSDDPATRQEAEFAMRHVNNVRSHLADWLGTPDALRARSGSVLLVGRTETLAEDFERLKSLLGLPATCALPEDEFRAHRAPGARKESLSEAAAANIRAWYAQDVELLAVCDELRARDARDRAS